MSIVAVNAIILLGLHYGAYLLNKLFLVFFVERRPSWREIINEIFILWSGYCKLLVLSVKS